MSDRSGLKPLPPGEGFAFNYQPSRIDRNALYALQQVYDRKKISLARTEYHRAKLSLDELRNDLLEYSVPKVSRDVNDAYYAILESVDIDIFGDCKTPLLSHSAVAAKESFPGHKSPGLPLKSQGFRTKREAVDTPEILDSIKQQWKAIERREEVVLPDVACYARAQVCKREKNKVRATWGYPLTVFLTEAQFFYPLLDAIKDKAQPTLAYGLEMGNGGMEYIEEMCSAYPTSNYLIGDWSKFDKTVPAWLIRDAFKLVARHIDFATIVKKDGTTITVDPAKTKRRWERVVKYFIDTPIQLSTGERFVKVGGVPSGSVFTNLIDGIVNAIVTRYLVYSLTGEMSAADVVLGDDFVSITSKPIDLELFAELAKEKFTMVFNVDKSYQTGQKKNVHFLGYFNHHGYPRKPVDTIIVSAIYPERPITCKFETAVRLVGQAYACFDPDDAKKFFFAAQVLKQEVEGLTDNMIEEYIKDHTHWFKYLGTLGIKSGLKVVSVKQG